MLYRVPRGIPLSNPPSYCPSCNTKLKGIDLIPVVSYLMFGRKCHYCEAPVSSRYCIIELLSIFIFTVAYVMVGAQVALLPALILSINLMFAVGLWIESRLVASKVLLFSIIVTYVLVISWR
tara:strand:+ start:170704 stop:171069 length:366 start_codon:yes stop_codon:yes gene_type:complete